VLVNEAAASGCRRQLAVKELGISQRTEQRWKSEEVPGDQRRGPLTAPANKLAPEERQEVAKIATSAEYRDMSPAKIVPLLADKGEFIASESSFYRILKAQSLAAHRSSLRPRTHHKPEAFEATAPNQVWTWDISYLRSTVRGIYFYLYIIVDIYSRKIVGWEVNEIECAELSKKLMQEAFTSEGITGKGLVIHSDNGGPMKGATLLATLEWLGVVTSFSRPRVSDDNPFSESLFRTLKYCPAFPSNPLSSIEEWRKWVKEFVDWYHAEPHSSIKFVTPSDRHEGKDGEILARRTFVYENAKALNPCRWSGSTRNWDPIRAVKLNPGREVTR
jgi:transposase InsO family protein